MRRLALGLLAVSMVGAAVCAGAEAPAFKFKTEEERAAFEEGKEAFLDKRFAEAMTLLAKAKKGADDAQTRMELARWEAAFGAVDDYQKMAAQVGRNPGWVYENAQRRYLLHYATPARELFAGLIAEIESPDKGLVVKIEDFEDRRQGRYTSKQGKFYVTREAEPARVIEGNLALKWVTDPKERLSAVFRVSSSNMPSDWSEYDFLGFWMYGTPKKGSKLQVSLVNRDEPGQAAPKARTRLDGFQSEIPPHEGWKFVTLGLKSRTSGSLGFWRVGSGDLSKVGFLQFQLPTNRPFEAYFDNIVLFKSK